ncbi:MAG: FHA domain-containing protein [Selenomonadaceae bacterium]|nr:FHA domain-containing protein [Selenomonadaceae bacterium]
MPTMALFIKILSVIMEYGMLLWLLYFVSRSVRYIWLDMKKTGKELSDKAKASAGEAMLTVVESGDEEQVGRRFAFSDEIRIGRGPDNDIRIFDSFVSHHHAVVFLRNNLYVIEDLGSRNHTYVNDRQLSGKAYLKAGDLIRIGFLTLKFER